MLLYTTNKLYLRARLSHETQIKNIITQLVQLDTPSEYITDLTSYTSFSQDPSTVLPLQVGTIEQLKLKVAERVKLSWDSILAVRGSTLNSNSNLLMMLQKNPFAYTYSHHVLRLGIQYLMGRLPFRYWDQKTLCRHCMQPYDSLDHLKYECTNNILNLDRDSINNTFQNKIDLEIFDLLKKLKSLTLVA